MKAFAIEILTSPAFHLITLLLGFLIGHHLAIGRDKRNDFNKAATIFREAFLPELIFLRHNAKVSGSASSSDLGEFLRAGYIHRHMTALEVFSNYLPTKERAGINKAWKKYCCHPDNPKILYFEQYSNKSASNTRKNEAELEKIALERIEGIVKFAKHR